jgi:hypothetical protein
MNCSNTILNADSEKFGQIVASLIQRLYTPEISSPAPVQTRSLPLNIFIHKTIKAVQLPEQIHFLSVYYMTQVRIKNPSLSMKPGMEYILVIACMILAQKVLDDHRWTNQAWARLTGLPLREINVMERELLNMLSYSLNVTEKEYNDWVDVLTTIAKKDEERLRLQEAKQVESQEYAYAEMQATVSKRRSSHAYESYEHCAVEVANMEITSNSPMKMRRRSEIGREAMVLRSRLVTPPLSP